MIQLNTYEKKLSEQISSLKKSSGSHPPSIYTVIKSLENLSIKVDSCFLSNPYATEIFLKYFNDDIIENNKIRDLVEFYPSQNSVIAESLAKTIDIPKENILIGNGTIEIIQYLSLFLSIKKMVLILPTFSSYYEFLPKDTSIIHYTLNKEEDFQLNIDNYIKFVKIHQPDTIVLINPNNPNGRYIDLIKLEYICESLKEVSNIIIDESFIHFAYEDETLSPVSSSYFIHKFCNVTIIKSMSKDFGIAGIRAGYCLLPKIKIEQILSKGFLWNSNGLSEYFFDLYSRSNFQKEYEEVRTQYIKQSISFFHSLKSIDQIKAYSSKANFALIELLDGSKSFEFVHKLLIKNGIYTRDCEDKIGLNGEFVRIASRKDEENQYTLSAIKNLYK